MIELNDSFEALKDKMDKVINKLKENLIQAVADYGLLFIDFKFTLY